MEQAELKMARGKNKPKAKTWKYIVKVTGTAADVEHALAIVRGFDQTADVQYVENVGTFISTNVEKAASVVRYSIPSSEIVKPRKA